MSSRVSWHTATHLSGISATTWAFTLQIHHSVTPAQWGWTLPIQRSDSSWIKQHLLPHLWSCPWATETCCFQIQCQAATQEKNWLMQRRQKESVTDQLTYFIFYKFWKWKQITFSFGIIQIINLKHRNLNSFSLFHWTDKDVTQLYPLKWRQQKSQYIFSVSFPKITIPNKLREKPSTSTLVNWSSRIPS